MRAPQVVLILLIGIALGVAGAIYGPQLAGPYLPEGFLVKKPETVEGEVVRKQREGDRLLLTVQTSQGTVLATFKKKVSEIDLLVQQGDTLTLALTRYEPFVEDPAIDRVRKQEPSARPKVIPPPAPTEAEPPSDKPL